MRNLKITLEHELSKNEVLDLVFTNVSPKEILEFYIKKLKLEADSVGYDSRDRRCARWAGYEMEYMTLALEAIKKNPDLRFNKYGPRY